MVHRPSDSRLLNNLISHEKDYSKSLSSLLSSSHASYTSLTAYAASSPPPASQVILAVAGTLLHADEAFRAYARAVDEWRAMLQELKDLEDEVGNVMRDREILVTRLLKASSKAASKHQPSSSSASYDTASVVTTPASTSTLSLSSTTSSNTKLQAAQAELQACEAHLAMKEQELERTRTSAVREGLRVRFRALAECGARWVEVGKEVEVVLGVSGDYPNRGETTSPRPSSDISHTTMSSIAPSQSASQVGVASPGPARLVLGQNDLDMPVLPASPHLGLPLSIPLPSSPGPQPPRKHILPHRITEESLSTSPSPEPKHQPESSQRAEKEEEEEEGAGSSAEEDEESRKHQVRIVENPKFAPSTTSFSKSSTSSSTVKGRPRAKSESVTSFSRQNPSSSSPLKSSLGLQPSSSVSHTGTGTGGHGFFGSIRGLFGGKKRDRDRDETGSVNSIGSSLLGVSGSVSAGGSGVGSGVGVGQNHSREVSGTSQDSSQDSSQSGSGVGKGKLRLSVLGGKKKKEKEREWVRNRIPESSEDEDGAEANTLTPTITPTGTIKAQADARPGVRGRVVSDVGYASTSNSTTPRPSFTGDSGSGTVTPTQANPQGAQSKRLKKRSLRGRVVEREWERAGGTSPTTPTAPAPGIKASTSDLGIPTLATSPSTSISPTPAPTTGIIKTTGVGPRDPSNSPSPSTSPTSPSRGRPPRRPLSRGNDLVDEEVVKDLEMKARRRSASVDHLDRLDTEDEEEVVDLGVWDVDDDGGAEEITVRGKGGKKVKKKVKEEGDTGKGKGKGHARSASLGGAGVDTKAASTPHLPSSVSVPTPIPASSAGAGLARSSSTKSSKSTKSTKKAATVRRSILTPGDASVPSMLPSGAPTSALSAPVPPPKDKDKDRERALLSPLGSDLGLGLGPGLPGLEGQTRGGLVGVPVLSLELPTPPASTETRGPMSASGSFAGGGTGGLVPPAANTGRTKKEKRASAPPNYLSGGDASGAGSAATGAGAGAGTSLMSIVEDVAKANREAWASRQGQVRSVGGTMKPVGLVDRDSSLPPIPSVSASASSTSLVLGSREQERGGGLGGGPGGLLEIRAPPSISIEELEGMNLGAPAIPAKSHGHVHGHTSASASAVTLSSVGEEREGRVGRKKSVKRTGSTSRTRTGERSRSRSRAAVVGEKEERPVRVEKEEFVQGSSGIQRRGSPSPPPTVAHKVAPKPQQQQVVNTTTTTTTTASPATSSSSSPVSVTGAVTAKSTPSPQMQTQKSLSPQAQAPQVLPPMSPMGTGLSAANANASGNGSPSPNVSPNVSPNSSPGTQSMSVNQNQNANQVGSSVTVDGVKQPSRPAHSPLRSALKNPTNISRTPSPMVLGSAPAPAPNPASVAAPVQVVKSPEEIVPEPEPMAPKVELIAPVPVAAVIPPPLPPVTDSSSEEDTETEATPVIGQVALPPIAESPSEPVPVGNGDARPVVVPKEDQGDIHDDDSDGESGSGSSDGASISSYETGHEMFDEFEDAQEPEPEPEHDVESGFKVDVGREQEEEDETETEGEEDRVDAVPSTTYVHVPPQQTQVEKEKEKEKAKGKGYFDIRRPGVSPPPIGLNGNATLPNSSQSIGVGSDVSSPGSGGTATPIATSVPLPLVVPPTPAAVDVNPNSNQTEDQNHLAVAAAGLVASTMGTTTAGISTPMTSGTSTPQRRKSVRVSLKPTFSATPPAIEYSSSEEDASVSHQSHSSEGHGWSSGGQGQAKGDKDMWADSSDEDEEYSRARRLLGRVMRKGKGKKRGAD